MIWPAVSAPGLSGLNGAVIAAIIIALAICLSILWAHRSRKAASRGTNRLKSGGVIAFPRWRARLRRARRPHRTDLPSHRPTAAHGGPTAVGSRRHKRLDPKTPPHHTNS